MRRRRGKNKVLQGKSRPEKPPLDIREEIPIKIHQTFRKRIQSINWFVGVLVTFSGVYYPISDALREPEIHPSLAQIDAPFVARFSLHNPSNIFSMEDVRLTCVLLKVKRAEIPNLMNIPVDDGIIANIPAGKTIEYGCPIEKAIELDLVVQATIRIDAKFRTLGYERTTKSELFNWDISSRQWIKGEVK